MSALRPCTVARVLHEAVWHPPAAFNFAKQNYSEQCRRVTLKSPRRSRAWSRGSLFRNEFLGSELYVAQFPGISFVSYRGTFPGAKNLYDVVRRGNEFAGLSRNLSHASARAVLQPHTGLQVCPSEYRHFMPPGNGEMERKSAWGSIAQTVGKFEFLRKIWYVTRVNP